MPEPKELLSHDKIICDYSKENALGDVRIILSLWYNVWIVVTYITPSHHDSCFVAELYNTISLL